MLVKSRNELKVFYNKIIYIYIEIIKKTVAMQLFYFTSITETGQLSAASFANSIVSSVG